MPRSFLRDAQRFFSHLFSGVVGLHPSSFHRMVRKLRRFLEPLRRQILSEMIGDPEPRVLPGRVRDACRTRGGLLGAGHRPGPRDRVGQGAPKGTNLYPPDLTFGGCIFARARNTIEG